MSTLKTATSALTAAVLVTSIGLAFAQTEDQPQQQQPAEPTAMAAATTSEQTPADPNAAPVDANAMPADSTLAQQQPADDPAKVTPPVDSTAAQPSTTATDATTSTTTTSPSYDQPATPAPRADRH
jgi:hypothetical protein